jgi:hypothetical protein
LIIVYSMLISISNYTGVSNLTRVLRRAQTALDSSAPASTFGKQIIANINPRADIFTTL